MKKTFFTIAFLATTIPTFAQQGFKLTTGLNYGLPILKNANEKARIGLFLTPEYRFRQSNLGLAVHLSFDQYAGKRPQELAYYNPSNMRSVAVIPTLNYYWSSTSIAQPFAGVGLGASVDNAETGVFNPGHTTRLVTMGTAGVTLWRHLQLSLQYKLSAQTATRLQATVGYTF